MGHGDQNLNLPNGHSFEPAPERVKALQALIGGPFHFGRPITDRSAWEKIGASEAGQRLLALAEIAGKDEPRAYITNEDCLYVIETSDRSKFDPLPGRVRERQVLLPIAECIENQGRYLARIEDDIRRHCALNMWTFPLFVRSRQLFERTEYFTDLATVHYANNLVTALHLLGDRLKPETRDLIRREIETRVFKPFEERIKTGRDLYWWTIVTHNWNSVCLSGVLSCALRLKEDPAERAWYLAVVEKLIKHSEDGFEPSGFYTEGVAYWGYGYSHYILAAELVRGATGGAIDWLHQPRVEHISHFGHRMEIQNGVYPSFSDCRRDVVLPDWLMHWHNNRLDPARKSRDTAVPTRPFDPIHFQFADIVHLVLFHQEDINQAYAVGRPRAVREWFEDVQFLICRPNPDTDCRLAATFKGGDNAANHNHNDLGTFTVISGKEELLVDPGAEIYTRRTFSVHRYESNLLNSFGHPVPVVGGQLQFPDQTYHRTGFGRDAYTKLVDTTFTAGQDRVIIEMDRAYKVPHLMNLIRAFTYDRTGRGRIEVSDKVKFSTPDTFETALITYGQWELKSDGSLIVSQNGEAVTVTVTSDQGPMEFAHCVIQESSTPTRLSWRLPAPVLEAVVRISVVPA
ncbi:MAG: heparinase II/III family protein [Opitutaceae bacterium]|nr:heparinase II/III family protein [Opitutaceae bacterium]